MQAIWGGRGNIRPWRRNEEIGSGRKDEERDEDKKEDEWEDNIRKY